MATNDFYNEMVMKKYFNSINEIKLLSQEEETELAIAKGNGDEIAREKLVKANLRLVIKISKNYLSLESSLIDLIQEGNLGLIRASEKFDYKMGCRFSTYASYWIKHYITRFIAKKSRTIRVPIRKSYLYKKISKAQEVLLTELGREPTNAEISKLLKIDERIIADIIEIFQPTVSLEYPFNSDEFNLHKVVGDSKYLTPDDGIYQNDLKNELEEAMNSLMDNEKKILRLRFGFDDDRPITLKEVGNEFGISAETVRQIEARAIEKLKTRFPQLQVYMEN